MVCETKESSQRLNTIFTSRSWTSCLKTVKYLFKLTIFYRNLATALKNVKAASLDDYVPYYGEQD